MSASIKATLAQGLRAVLFFLLGVVPAQVNAVTLSPEVVLGPEPGPNKHAPVASDANGNVVVVFAKEHVSAIRFGAESLDSGQFIQVSETPALPSYTLFRPDVAMAPDGAFVVAWTRYPGYSARAEVVGRRFDATGAAQGPEFVIASDGERDSGPAAVAIDSTGNFVVAWISTPPEAPTELRFQRFTSTNEPAGPILTVTSEFRNRVYPDILVDAEGNAWVAWAGDGVVHLWRNGADGTIAQQELESSSDVRATPKLAALPEGFLMAWLSCAPEAAACDVYANRFSSDGLAVGERFKVNARSTAHPGLELDHPLSLASNISGDWVISWQWWPTQWGDDGQFVVARQYRADGSARGEEFPLDSGAFSPEVAPDAEDGFTAVWISIYEWAIARRFKSLGSPIDLKVEIEGADPVHWGEAWSYNVIAYNDGPSSAFGVGAATGAMVEVEISGEATVFDIWDEGWSCKGDHPIRCLSVEPLEPHNGSRRLTFGMRAPSGGSSSSTWAQLTASIVGVEDDPDPSNNTASARTVISDIDPDPFSFTTLVGVEPNTVQTSNAVTITGIGVPVSISANGGQYSINGAPFTAVRGSISEGDELRLQHVSHRYAGGSSTMTVYVGRGQATFTTKNVEPDSVPDPFYFADQSNVARSTVVTSETITVSGIDEGVVLNISVSGGTYSKDGGAFTTQKGAVVRGSQIRVRHVSSSGFSSSVQSVLTIGTVSGTFTSTTIAADTVPDPFAFVDAVDVQPATTITSGAIVVGGIEAPATISVTNGTYSLGGGAFTSTPGNVAPGQSVRVQHLSSSGFSSSVQTVLTIGTVSGTFTSTTIAADGVPDPFAFVDMVDVSPATTITSEAIAVSGINTPATISVANGAYSIDGGVFTSAPGNVAPGRSVRVQHLSSSGFLASVDTLLTIGGMSDTFTSTTVARDAVPDAFGFANRTDVLRNTTITSDAIVVSGINDAVPVSVKGGRYSVDGAAFTKAAGTVRNGQQIRVQHTSSSEFSESERTVLTTGGVSGTFTSTTEAMDVTPDTFSFIDQSGVLPLAEVTSNTITVGGINAPAAIAVSGADGRYAVNGGAYTNATGTVKVGDTVTLRVTSAAVPQATVNVTVTIGTLSDTWSVKTLP